MENVERVLIEISKFDKEPVEPIALENSLEERDMEMSEKIREPQIINAVMCEAGVDLYKHEHGEYDENEGYYEQF